MVTFGAWCQDQQIAERLLPLHIGAAFEVIVSRIDTPPPQDQPTR